MMMLIIIVVLAQGKLIGSWISTIQYLQTPARKDESAEFNYNILIGGQKKATRPTSRVSECQVGTEVTTITEVLRK